MKTFIIILIIFISTTIEAQKSKITFMPQWTAQSQFAGFYIAKDKGFYDAEGLDVEIKHIEMNSTRMLFDYLVSGDVNIVEAQLFQGISVRAIGNKILNVCQLSQNCGLWCVSHEKISQINDLKNKKIGKWKMGFSEICEILSNDKNLNIQWVPFISGINLYVYGAVDATLCYSYSEYIKLILSLGEIEGGHVLRFSDMGYNYPEDGLYVTESYYAEHKDDIDKFIKATKKGWEYAAQNRQEAVEISMKYVKANNIVTNLRHQRLMLDEVLKLFVNPVTGNMDFAPVDENIFQDMVDVSYENKLINNKITYKDLIR